LRTTINLGIKQRLPVPNLTLGYSVCDIGIIHHLLLDCFFCSSNIILQLKTVIT